MKAGFVTTREYVLFKQCKMKLYQEYFHSALSNITPDADKIKHHELRMDIIDNIRNLYPKGIITEQSIHNSQTFIHYLSQKRPLYRVQFNTGTTVSLTDVLNPVADNSWDIIKAVPEKSLSDKTLNDLTFQKYSMDLLNIKIRKVMAYTLADKPIEIANIDTSQVPKAMAEILQMVKSEQWPDLRMGEHCVCPEPCVLMGICMKDNPQVNTDIINKYLK